MGNDRNIGFAPSYTKAKESARENGVLEGVIVVGAVSTSLAENVETAKIIINFASDVRERCSSAGISDGAAVFAGQVFSDLKLRVFNQAEFDTLIRIFRGFEVACVRMAVLRNQQN